MTNFLLLFGDQRRGPTTNIPRWPPPPLRCKIIIIILIEKIHLYEYRGPRGRSGDHHVCVLSDGWQLLAQLRGRRFLRGSGRRRGGTVAAAAAAGRR